MSHLEGATPAPERLDFIDSLRGFALFGVFCARLANEIPIWSYGMVMAKSDLLESPAFQRTFL
jgi:uncharacterized membrane protein YeiB